MATSSGTCAACSFPPDRAPRPTPSPLPTSRMAVIVSTAAPCLIRTPPTPTPTHDSDFTTPRSLHSLDIVAVAAATIPTLPLDPTTNSTYRLTTKRKSEESLQDDDDDDDDDDTLSQPHLSKRFKSDPLSLNPPSSESSVPIDHVLAAIYPPPPPTASLPSHQSQQPPFLSSSPDLLTHPYPTLDNDGDIELTDDVDLYQDDPRVHIRGRLPTRELPPGATRALEMPLWKLACRARIDHIINVYGYQPIRDSVQRDILNNPPLPSPFPLPGLVLPQSPQSTALPEPGTSETNVLSPPSPPISTSYTIQGIGAQAPPPSGPHPEFRHGLGSQLQLEICTPLDFVSSERRGSDRLSADGITDGRRVGLSNSAMSSSSSSSFGISSSSLDVEMKSVANTSDAGSLDVTPTTNTTHTVTTGNVNEVDYMVVSLDAESSLEYDWDSDTDSDCDFDLLEFEQGEDVERGGEGIRQSSFPQESVLDIPPVIGSSGVGSMTTITERVSKDGCCDSSCSALEFGSSSIPTPFASSSSSSPPPSPSPSSFATHPSSCHPSPPTIELVEGATAPIHPALALFPLPQISSIPAYPLRDGYPDLVMRGTPARVAGWARGRLGRGV